MDIKVCKFCKIRPVRLENRKGKFYKKVDCSYCHNKKYKQKYLEKHKNYDKISKKRSKIINRTWLEEYLKTKSCNCGESDRATLDFHHRNPEEKLFCISNGLKRSLITLQAEVAKCDIICSNCHFKLHATNPKNHNWKKKKQILDALGTECCFHCNEKDIKTLVFHHHENNKSFTISKNYGLDISLLIEEAAKCWVLCQNCHRKVHHIPFIPPF